MKVPHKVVGRTENPLLATDYLKQEASPEAFGAGIGRSLQTLSATLQAAADKEDEETKRRALFDVNMRHADEALFATQDFEQRANSAPLGAPGFSKQVLADYEKRHQTIIADMQKTGAPEEAIQSMQLKLADLRGGLVSQSLTFQRTSHLAKVGADTQHIALSLSQLASMNPNEMEAAREELYEAVDNIPDLDALQKQKLKNEYGETIALAAGYGLARQNPVGVVQALTGGVEASPGGYYTAIRKHESGGKGTAKNPRSSATGFYQWTDDTWKGLMRRYPEAGLTADGRGNAAQEEVAIRLFTSENANVLARNRLSSSDANLYAAHFLGAGGAVSVLTRPNEQRLDSILPPVVMNANPHLHNKTVGWFKAWTQRVVGTKGVDMLAPPIDGQTGDPVLDALTPAQRMQVLSSARTELDRQQADARAGLGVRVTNAEAALLSTGEFGGQMPTQEEFFKAYDPVEAEQRWAAFSKTAQVGEFIKDMKMLTAEEIATRVEAMMPTNTASPTYAAELAGFQAAQTAQINTLKQREDDPAGYVIRNFPAVEQALSVANDSESRRLAMAEMIEAYKTLGMRPSQMVPFSQSAIEARREQFVGMTPEQKLTALTDMKLELGEMFDNGLTQLAKEGMPVEAYLAGLVSSSPDHQSVAANVLRGLEIIANDPSRKPKPDQINETFRAELGAAQQVISPMAADAMNRAATALYVFEGGDPQVIDSAGFEKALRQVVGGLPEDDTTGIVALNQSTFSDIDFKTILPPGVNEEQMTNWIDALSAEELDRLGNGIPIFSGGEVVSPQHIADEGVFVRVGADEFVVYMESDGKPLMTQTGDYFRVRVTKGDVINALP